MAIVEERINSARQRASRIRSNCCCGRPSWGISKSRPSRLRFEERRIAAEAAAALVPQAAAPKHKQAGFSVYRLACSFWVCAESNAEVAVSKPDAGKVVVVLEQGRDRASTSGWKAMMAPQAGRPRRH